MCKQALPKLFQRVWLPTYTVTLFLGKCPKTRVTERKIRYPPFIHQLFGKPLSAKGGREVPLLKVVPSWSDDKERKRRLCPGNWFRLPACCSPEKEEIGNPLGENRDKNTEVEIQKYWAKHREILGQKYKKEEIGSQKENSPFVILIREKSY